jgi:glycosyltransferase involved in cell wall biosynthesis
VALDFSLVELLEYCPVSPGEKQRLAVVTPHLGPGGAESVLLDILASLDREKFEILVLATQSKDDAWACRWQARAAHVYDLAKVVSLQKMTSAICSFVKNWQCQTVLVQNSLYGYAALPHIKRMDRDGCRTRTIDVIHAIDKTWDQVSASGGAAASIDVRVAVSDSVQRHLLGGGTPAGRIRLTRGGVDLERFRPAPTRPSGVLRILFAGRIDPVKRPELLVDIAAKLLKRPGHRQFRFVVAGDGPRLRRLRERVKSKQMETIFDFLGQVEDLAPVFHASDIVILPSRSEGVPLVLLEALACARPVVASRVGDIPQLIDDGCGILIDVSPNDASDFAAALESLLGDPELRETMGREGRRKVEAGYDLRTVRTEYAEILNSE